jgi:hypothetical protein
VDHEIMAGHRLGEPLYVERVGLDERRGARGEVGGHERARADREVIVDGDRPARHERVDHVAADEARAADDEGAHD